MSKIFSPISALFKFHKLKALGVLALALVFALWIFPYDDLTDLATSKISQLTNNQVYVSFDSLDLGFIPPGVSLGNVSVETPTLPAVKTSHLEASPWLGGLITGKQGGSVDAKDLFGGVVAADVHQGDKTKSGERVDNIAFDAKNLQLPQLAKFMSDGGIGTFLLQGILSAETQLVVDPSFSEQPSGDISLNIKNLMLPSQSIHTAMMPIAIPDLKFGDTKLKAKVGDGSVQISDFSFGNDASLAGKITGTVGVKFMRGPAGIQPLVSAYDLRINLKMPTAFANANASSLTALYGFLPQTAKKITAKGTELAFRLQPPVGGSQFPTFSTIQ